MLGKLYALCLCKYVRLLLIHRGRVRWPQHVYPVKVMISAHEYLFTVAFSSVIAHNYKYTDDSGFTSARASSAGPEHTGRHPPAPPGCERSSFSRQRILRSERSGAGQVRDAAQRRAGGPSSGGSGPSLWPVPPGLLCHSGVVQSRRPARVGAAQARAKAAPQAQRRSDGRPARGYRRGWTDAQKRGVSGGSGAALWHRGPSTQSAVWTFATPPNGVRSADIAVQAAAV